MIAEDTDSLTGRGLWMLVYTALENCEYHGGAPAGKIGFAWFSISDCSVAAPGTLPDLTRSDRPPRLDGSGNV